MNICNHTVALEDSHYVQVLMILVARLCWHVILELGYGAWPHMEELVVVTKLPCPVTGWVLSDHFDWEIGFVELLNNFTFLFQVPVWSLVSEPRLVVDTKPCNFFGFFSPFRWWCRCILVLTYYGHDFIINNSRFVQPFFNSFVKLLFLLILKFGVRLLFWR